MNINPNYTSGMNLPSKAEVKNMAPQELDAYMQSDAFKEQVIKDIDTLHAKRHTLLLRYNDATTPEEKQQIERAYGAIQHELYFMITNAPPEHQVFIGERNKEWTANNQQLYTEIENTGAEALQDSYDGKLLAYDELMQAKTSVYQLIQQQEPESPIWQKLQARLSFFENKIEEIKTHLKPDQLDIIKKAGKSGNLPAGYTSVIQLHEDYDGGVPIRSIEPRQQAQTNKYW
jgi:hypothetical protein